MTISDFLRQAQPDCPSCAGTGIIEGEMRFSEDHLTWERDADRVCYCVPIMIIRAPDA